MSIDEKLIQILACPRCKEGVRLSEDKSGLICGRCKLRYIIKDGIPIMLADEAIKLENLSEELRKSFLHFL